MTRVLVHDGHVTGVETDKTACAAPAVVNCAGAWSGQVGPVQFPTRPVKGQMLALVGEPELLRHVIRTRECYLVPRSDVGLSSVQRSRKPALTSVPTPTPSTGCIWQRSRLFRNSPGRGSWRVGPDCAPARPTVYLCWEKLQLRDTLRPPGTFVTVFS